MTGRTARTVGAVSVAAYVGLGLPSGALGVMWPSMRADFGQPLAALGLVLVAFTGGYLFFAVVHGRVAHRVDTGLQLAVASAACALAVAGIAGAPVWAVVLLASVVQGSASADVDAELNAHVAVHHEPHLLHLMHGGFGVGATVGPVLVTAVLGLGLTWRAVSLVMALWWAVVTVAFARTRPSFRPGPLEPRAAPSDDARVAGTGPARPPMLPVVIGLGLVTFFFYNGVEIAVGSWAYTYLLHDGFGTTSAGVAVTSYWAALMVGRLGLGALGRRVTPRAILWVSMGVVPSAACLLLPGGPWAVAGLVLLGVGLAGIFPSLVALTPHRLGPDRARRVMGLQFGAAVVGAAVLSALVGVVAERQGEAAIAPAVVILTGALVVAYLGLTAAAAAPAARRSLRDTLG